MLAPPPGELGQQQINVEADDSLAGQRTHGLPNITGSGQQRSKDSGKDTTVCIFTICKDQSHTFVCAVLHLNYSGFTAKTSVITFKYLFYICYC